jgi:hypothetical protein
MKEQFKKFLNEEQDQSYWKIAAKLSDLMKNEEIGFIVQKKTFWPFYRWYW